MKMTTLRDQSKPVLYGLVILFILAMGGFANILNSTNPNKGNSEFCDPEQYIACSDDENISISVEEFNRRFNNDIDYWIGQATFNNQFNGIDKQIDTLNAKDRVWNSILNDRIRSKFIKELKLIPKESYSKAMIKFIKEYPTFNSNYKAELESYGLFMIDSAFNQLEYEKTVDNGTLDELINENFAINKPEFSPLSEKSKGLAYDPFCEDFILGSGGVISDFDRESKTQNTLVIRGLGGGGQKAIKFCREKGRDFYAIDTGYMQPVWTTRKDYHRVTKNNLQNLGPIVKRPDDRLSRLGWRPSKFKKGSYILVCPPSAKVMKFYGQDVDEWMKTTLSELKKHTDREVVVRLKPSRRERVTQNTIWDALQEAHCLVTFNSIAATEALLVGKPAIALAPNAASVLCNNSLHDVESGLNHPTLDEVHAFACHLSYCQFTANELRSGYAWDILNESS